MPTLEDCLEKLDEINWDPPVDNEGRPYGISNTWDRRFVSEVAYHTRDNLRALSTGQVGVLNKLVDRYRVQLELSGFHYQDIESVLAGGLTRLPPTPSSQAKREVRWIGDSWLLFRFKFNPEIKEALKALKSQDCFGTHKTFYEPKNHLWAVPLSISNYETVIKIIGKYGFDFDDSVAEILMHVSNSKLAKSEARLVDDEICVEAKDDALMAAFLGYQEEVWKSDV